MTERIQIIEVLHLFKVIKCPLLTLLNSTAQQLFNKACEKVLFAVLNTELPGGSLLGKILSHRK